MIGSVILRRATEADAAVASRLLMLALHDLDAQAGRPPRFLPELSCEPALRHLVRTDRERFWIAEAAVGGPGTPAAEAAGGPDAAEPAGELEPIGFGVAMVRGSEQAPRALWFLAGLFIRPDWQRRGVGRVLLERTLAGYPAEGGVLAVVTSAANVQSNTLYAEYGMYPALPLLSLSRKLPLPGAAGEGTGATADETSGETGASAVARTSAVGGTVASGDLEAAPITPAEVDRLRPIDLEIMGIDRTVDHQWMLGEMERAGWLFLRAGAPVAYGYLGGDGSQIPDQVGPIVALDPGDQPAIAAFLLGRAAAAGWAAATVVVPGANVELQRCLWERGFVMSGTSELIGLSRPFGAFDRYAFLGDTLM
jgi:GNAT superfamily N-acetyltransferase